MRGVLGLVLVLGLLGSAFGDEISDKLARALALYEKGNFIGAQKELERAAELLGPKATAQIPPATVKGLRYSNYEYGFTVSSPSKDWKVQALQSRREPGALTVLVTMSYGPVQAGEIALFYMRNLREAYGAQLPLGRGKEPALLRDFGKKAPQLVGNLTDCSKGVHAELKVAGKPAISTVFTGTGKRDKKAMRSRVVQVLVGEELFTGIFISQAANWAERSRDFGKMVESMGFDVPMPEPVLTPPE